MCEKVTSKFLTSLEDWGKWERFVWSRWEYARCPFCGVTCDTPTNYCPECGTDMRKEVEQNDTD